MKKEFFQWTEESIKDTSLLHSDISAALVSLPSFGWEDSKSMSYIQNARAIVDELHLVLQQYVNIGTQYQQTLSKLFTLLENAEISDCVNDLIAVRRNARRSQKEREEYRLKLKRAV